MLLKIFKVLIAILIILSLVYALGPKVTFEDVSLAKVNLPKDLNQLEDYIKEKESKVLDLKNDNQARIIWADSTKAKTTYSVVYLHGFSASQEEGDPLHERFAKRYGCNLYLSRLADHGRLDSNSFKGITPTKLLRSAQEALEIGKLLGDSLIVMSCSTGSTFDIALADHHPEICGHIMYSPNIEIADPAAKLMTYPWGKEILELVMGGEISHIDYKESAKQYWLESYHRDGILALQYILDKYMTPEHFLQIDRPLFLGCYYKNDEEQDDVVSVEAMRSFFETVQTESHQKVFREFPNAGRHVISSHIFSLAIEEVQKETFEFAENILNLKPQNIE